MCWQMRGQTNKKGKEMADNKSNTEVKEEIIELLKSTGRDGIDDTIAFLEESGFFTAPASASKHLCVEGGLARHSLNTCRAALLLWKHLAEIEPTLHNEVKRESVIIASLLHDVCKADIYRRSVKRRKVMGLWEESEGYKVSYKNFPMGHGEKSVILLLCAGLDMYDDEMLAIRWHMGAWGLNLNSIEDTKSYDTANKSYPLVNIIQCADTIAANIMERTGAELDDY